jgi:subtilisin-like proprotein convertase family protein
MLNQYKMRISIISHYFNLMTIVLICASSLHLSAQTFPGSAGALTDNNCLGNFDTFTANVSGVGPTDVIQSVTINISHTWVSELNLFLEGPNGQKIELSTGNGGGLDNYTNTVFTDASSSFITSGTPPFTGSFKPEGRTNSDNQCNPAGTVGTYTFASQFWGSNCSGNWILKIKDGGGGDVGTLNSWSVTIIPLPPQQNIGINTSNPQATLDVNGKIKVGNDQVPGVAGTIRYSSTSNDFEGYNGTTWKSMTGSNLLVKRINDADNNTSVDVETNPNENLIRFTLDGSEKIIIRSNRIDLLNNGGSNAFIGENAGMNNSGIANSAFGHKAMETNTSGFANTAIGEFALRFNTTGSYNTGVGGQVLYNNTTGEKNSAFGQGALAINTTGISNSAFGYDALSSNTTAHVNSAFGNLALKYNTTGGENSAFGAQALGFNTTGGENSAFGRSSLLSNSTGNANSAFGNSALHANNGSENSAFGYLALYNNNNGSENSAFGSYAMVYNTSGSKNTAMGKYSGRFISNGSVNQTSSNSVYLGYDTRASQNGNTNEVVIGYEAIGNGSHTVTLGNNAVTQTYLKGAVNLSPIGVNTGQTGQIKLGELAANGTNNITLRSPDDLPNDVVFTLPERTSNGPGFEFLTGYPNGKLEWQPLILNLDGFTHPTSGSTFEIYTNNVSMTGQNNSSIGVGAGPNITSGADNSAFGGTALFNNTTGESNSAFGFSALNSNTSGFRNSAFGRRALGNITTGSNNIGIGRFAGNLTSSVTSNQTSNNSIYIGVDTRASQDGNTNEIVIGNDAVGSGSNTVTIGNNSTVLTNIKGVASYTPIGTNTGQTGQIKFQELVANGSNTITLKSPDNLASDVALTLPSNAGTNGQVLSTNGSGVLSWATAWGSGIGLSHPTTGSTFESGTNLPGLTGLNNTAIGVGAGVNFISGSDNVMIGTNALPSAGSNNVAIGSGALANAGYFEDGGVAIGKNALQFDERGYNVAVGYEALSRNGQGNLSGSDAAANTAVGNGALRNNNRGAYNTAMGNFALYDNTVGYENTAVGSNALWLNITGNENTAFGKKALHSNKFGNRNTGIGFESMSQFVPSGSSSENDNTSIGWRSGHNLDSHARNTFIGSDASSTVFSGITNSTALGYGSRTTANNQIRIGNSSVTSIGGFANWTNISDGRFKKNIKEDVHGLDFILNLRPVTYQLSVTELSSALEEDKHKEVNKDEKLINTLESDKQDRQKKEEIIYTGFIAQEVEQAANSIGFNFSGVDKPENEKSLWGLRYSEFVVPLVKAVQEQQIMIEKLIKENELLKEERVEIQRENTEIKNAQNKLAAEMNTIKELILKRSDFSNSEK